MGATLHRLRDAATIVDDAHTRDATGFLTVYLVLLIALPAQLVVGQLGASGTPANMLGIAGLLWWAATRLLPPTVIEKGFQPTHVGIALFSAAIVVSFTAANLDTMPVDELNAADRGLLSLMAWAGVALVTGDLVVRLGNLDKLMRRFVWLAGALAAMGILQFATGFDISELYHIPGLVGNHPLEFIGERSEFRRVAGTALHPIEFGMVLAAAFPLVVHMVLYSKVHRRAFRVILAMVAVSIPMSLSRSAFLGLLIGSVVLLSSWSWPRRLRAIGWGAVFAVVMRFLIPGLLGTITSLFTGVGTDPSIQGRTDDFSQVGTFIGRAPFFGRGFGTFLPQRYFFVDNQYLGSIIETGFVGFAALLLLFVNGIFTARGARRHTDDEERRHLNNALAASLLTIMVGFVTFDGLGFPMIDGVMFFLIGCAGGQWRLTHKERGRPRPPDDDRLGLAIVPGPRVVLRPPPQVG